MNSLPFEVDTQKIGEFCRRWGLRELAIFGSVAAGAAHSQSDVDVLIALPPGHYPDIDEWENMQDELSKLFGRRVDLVSSRAIDNPFIRYHILTHRRVLYAA